jgi:protein phosphatase
MDEKLLQSREQYTREALEPFYRELGNELRQETAVYPVLPLNEEQRLMHLNALNNIMGDAPIPEGLVIPRNSDKLTLGHKQKQEAFLQAAKKALVARLKYREEEGKAQVASGEGSSAAEGDIRVAVGQSERSIHGEDTILRDDQRKLYGIFDGMGGVVRVEKDGAEVHVAKQASIVAAEAIASQYASFTDDPPTLDEALIRAQSAMASARTAVRERGDGGATTAVFCKVESINNQAFLVWGNAGDSRLFIQNGVQHDVIPLTTDQSAPDHVRNGLAAEQADWPEMEDEFGYSPLRVGDRIMLCSDGITGDNPEQYLTKEEMQSAFDLPFPDEAAERLVRISKKHDDKSALVFDVHGAEVGDEESPIGVVQKSYDEDSARTKSRLQDKWAKARTAALPAAVAAIATKKLFGGDKYRSESEKSRRKKVIAVVAGVAAVGLAYWASQKLGLFGHHPNIVDKVKPPDIDLDIPKKKPETPSVRNMAPQPPNIRHTHVHEHYFHTGTHFTLKSGGTIWESARHYLVTHGFRGSNSNIDQVSDAVRARYGLSETAARHLPIGYHFILPREAFEELSKSH